MVVGSLLGCTDTDYVTVNLHPLVTYPVIVFNGGWLNCTPTNYATYQWNMNNVPIVGANSSSYFPTTNNWYNCLITDTNGCIAYSNGIYVNLTGTVSQAGNMDLHLYPNPAECFIVLDLPAVTDETIISIKSINGQTIRTQSLSSGPTHTIQRDGLPAGVYLLEVRTSDGIAVTRVVFQ
ncbi:MAG: Pyrolysin [Bacteroidota bacterium]|jgi:hypothetical protein